MYRLKGVNMNEQLIQRKITEEFYWFHEHPELSYKEVETTKRLRVNLQSAGIKILQIPLKTGLVAEIGTGSAPIVALRCDIDALPVQEKTELPYRSKIDGHMHACGHDFHAAAILGAAYILKQHEQEINGTIRLIFQPAEEAPGGALKIIQSGALQDIQVIFGIHSSPLFPIGDIAIREGAVTAAVDRFSITFTGKGTHAAHPQEGFDPIVAAAAFISSVQSIISRNVNPFDANLVSITHFESGSNWNIIPEQAFLEGTVRTLTADDRTYIQKRILDLAKYTAKSYNERADVQWFSGPPATANDENWVAFAKEEAEKQQLKIRVSPFSLGGEDFAFYQEKIKGVFIQMGTGTSYPNHNPHFQVDPIALYPTSQYTSRLAVQAIEKIRQVSGSGKND